MKIQVNIVDPSSFDDPYNDPYNARPLGSHLARVPAASNVLKWRPSTQISKNQIRCANKLLLRNAVLLKTFLV